MLVIILGIIGLLPVATWFHPPLLLG
ncbi:MGF_110-7L [African swine fever virus]|nr:MGF 110-7L [African swine fever virus]WMP23987.1 MGF_110-7L [African swine fever virus]BDC47046.1 MGF_110-7L [African swine fever virus]BDC47229.1 MGF_110-7L [African swine fever virus]